MKWILTVSVICCGGLLLLVLLGANAGLILASLYNNWPLLLLVSALIVGIAYYSWRQRYLKKRR